MSDIVASTLVGSLIAMAIVWLAFVYWIFHRLRHRHIATYEAIGSPSLFWNNSTRSQWLFFKFLFKGQWQSLGDGRLSAVARLMQILFVVYLVAFTAMFVAFVIVGVRAG
jgi:hypothetical protein